MKRKNIVHTIESLFEKLHETGILMLQDFDAGIIHQFRVTYKKLRAFLRMLSFRLKKDQKLKLSKKIQEMYKLAGAIRDRQLQQQRITDVNPRGVQPPSSYLKLLQQQTDNSQLALLSTVKSKTFKKNNIKIEQLLQPAFSAKDFASYAKNKLMAVREIITADVVSEDMLHTIRKHLKDLFYNQAYFKKKGAKLLPKDRAYLDELLNQIGDVQDKTVAVNLVKPSLLKTGNEDAKTLKPIRKKWVSEKAELSATIIAKLKNDFGTATLQTR